MYNCLLRSDGPLSFAEKGIFLVYYTLALHFLSSFITPLFLKSKGQMSKFTFGFNRYVMLIHALHGAFAFLLLPLIDQSIQALALFKLAVLVHTITAFILLPNMSGTKIASISTVLFGAVINTYHLYILFILKPGLDSHELCRTTYNTFHALSGFTHTRYIVMMIEVFNLFDNPYAVGMYLAGFFAAVFTLGTCGPLVIISTTIVVALTLQGLEGTISLLRQYNKTPTELIPHLRPRTQRNTWQARAKEIHFMITDGRLKADMTPADTIFFLLDQDGDGFVSGVDIQQAVGSSLITHRIFKKRHMTKESLLREYPLLVSTLYAEYTQTLSKIAAASIMTLQGSQPPETVALTMKLARQCPYRSGEVHQENGDNALPEYETQEEHLEESTFCQELGKKD